MVGNSKYDRKLKKKDGGDDKKRVKMSEKSEKIKLRVENEW